MAARARISRIHVRRDLMAADRKQGTYSPALGVETSGQPKRYGRTVTITGPSRLVYQPDRPLKCGARAWIETTAEVLVE